MATSYLKSISWNDKKKVGGVNDLYSMDWLSYLNSTGEVVELLPEQKKLNDLYNTNPEDSTAL